MENGGNREDNDESNNNSLTGIKENQDGKPSKSVRCVKSVRKLEANSRQN
jgi:hypothetical protein